MVICPNQEVEAKKNSSSFFFSLAEWFLGMGLREFSRSPLTDGGNFLRLGGTRRNGEVKTPFDLSGIKFLLVRNCLLSCLYCDKLTNASAIVGDRPLCIVFEILLLTKYIASRLSRSDIRLVS